MPRIRRVYFAPMDSRLTQSTLLILTLTLAFSLRLYGLFDGLDQGHVYHPDTPKQVAAAERFMHGTFYTVTGIRACDGYPYFNSLCCAALRAPYYWGMKLMYRRAPDRVPPAMTFRFMRTVNALESTLAVAILYIIVLSLASSRTALGASLLLAVSPIDIVACHAANGDTAAALFGMTAALFAIRIYRHGTMPAYILATLCAVCSFSSKYYGAAAALPVVLAHLLRYFHRRPANGSFWGPVAAMGITATVAFFITNPGAITHPWATLKSMHAVMKYASDFSTGTEYTSLPLHLRFVQSMSLNIPYLVLILGPVICVAAMGFVLSTPFQRRAEPWLLISLPLFFIAVGLTMKPTIQTVYHVMITPTLIACAMLGIASLCRWRTRFHIARVISIILFLTCFLPLANAGWREALLFKLPDTRVLAANWMNNNVPARFHKSGSKYSLYASRGPAPDGAMGIAWMRSDFREPVLAGDPCIFRIDMEPEKRLTVFRNMPTEIWCSGTNTIRGDFVTPYFCLRPATNTSDLIVADSPLLAGTDRRIEFAGTLRRTIFSKTPLQDAVLFIQGPPGARTTVTIGGQRLHLECSDNGYAEASVRGLRRRLPYLKMGHLYRFAAATGSEAIMLHVAFDRAEADAVRAHLKHERPALQLTDSKFFSTYGVSRAYINALTP